MLLDGGQLSSIFCFQGMMSLSSFDTTVLQCFKSSLSSNGKESVENIHLVQRGPTSFLLIFHCQAIVTWHHLETGRATKCNLRLGSCFPAMTHSYETPSFEITCKGYFYFELCDDSLLGKFTKI